MLVSLLKPKNLELTPSSYWFEYEKPKSRKKKKRISRFTKYSRNPKNTMKPKPNLFLSKLHYMCFSRTTLSKLLPFYFPLSSLSLFESWWSSNTTNILNLILLIEGHLTLSFYFSLLIHKYAFVAFCLLLNYQQHSCPNMRFLVFFTSSSYLCCFLLRVFSFLFFSFFFGLGLGGRWVWYVYFSSIAVKLQYFGIRIWMSKSWDFDIWLRLWFFVFMSILTHICMYVCFRECCLFFSL